MIHTYRLISLILYPFLIVLIFFRKLINKEDKDRYKEKIFSSTFKKNFSEKKKLIWFHAASIGEVQSIIPIINQLNFNSHKFNFLITTVTLSSGNLIKHELKNYENLTHRYLPLDINFLIKKFISIWRPHLVFFVDSEIWPNLILNIKKKNIPLVIINGRITYKTFKRWMKVPKTAKKIFSSFSLILTSNLDSKEYFNKLGGNNIFHFGNIKFTNIVDVKKIYTRNKDALENKNFWCAASTHNNEEEFCIKTHIKMKDKIDNLLTIIAPRHIQRSKEIKKLCENYNLTAQIVYKNDIILKDSEIVIINSFGVLSGYFKYAKSVFVGKSILKKLSLDGGQNPILPAQLGCKIYHGPYVNNFKDVYKFLKSKKISAEVLNINELSDNLINDFKTYKKDLIKSQEMIEMIGKEILNKTTKKINTFINYGD
jgi:3-deoxy-D-manno-octulosonic-acid transferase